jgi:hypothetical protein
MAAMSGFKPVKKESVAKALPLVRVLIERLRATMRAGISDSDAEYLFIGSLGTIAICGPDTPHYRSCRDALMTLHGANTERRLFSRGTEGLGERRPGSARRAQPAPSGGSGGAAAIAAATTADPPAPAAPRSVPPSAARRDRSRCSRCAPRPAPRTAGSAPPRSAAARAGTACRPHTWIAKCSIPRSNLGSRSFARGRWRNAGRRHTVHVAERALCQPSEGMVLVV